MILWNFANLMDCKKNYLLFWLQYEEKRERQFFYLKLLKICLFLKSFNCFQLSTRKKRWETVTPSFWSYFVSCIRYFKLIWENRNSAWSSSKNRVFQSEKFSQNYIILVLNYSPWHRLLKNVQPQSTDVKVNFKSYFLSHLRRLEMTKKIADHIQTWKKYTLL